MTREDPDTNLNNVLFCGRVWARFARSFPSLPVPRSRQGRLHLSTVLPHPNIEPQLPNLGFYVALKRQ